MDLFEEDWENFQTTRVLGPDTSAKLWGRVVKNTTPRLFHVRWIAVAASVLLIMGLSWHFMARKQGVAFASMTNHTPQKMALTLSDGSTVELLPNSKLSYPEHFTASKRDVVLTGEATFTIAKDVAQPFTVHSNSVLITVLGTRFTVTSGGADNATKVILQEGKVMVNASKKDYYLTPGDIFLVKKGVAARVLHLGKDKDGCYVFNDYPLDVVFDQLQIIYNTKITYDRAELGNRTFIGKTDGKDSLYHILKSISLLNGFGLHRQEGFVIDSNPH